MWINRLITPKIEQALTSRPVVMLTGARQTGKSSLLQRLLPKAEYITLDRVSVAMEAEENPAHFFERLGSKTILDEVQYAPSLFRELKILVDKDRNTYGRWILTGSQRFVLMKHIQESLAGRISILHLETLSAKELRHSPTPFKKEPTTLLWKGGYPELWANPAIDSAMYFEDYIQTYLERDLNEIIKAANLRDFRRFITLCATRVGQLLNYSDIAKDVAVSANTIKQWISILEASGIICILPPYYGNINKRLIKAPKLYFCDTGLLCNLLNVNDYEGWYSHPQKGNLWENFVLNEYMKTTASAPGKNLFFYRDKNNVEIDFVIEKGGSIALIEAKVAERINERGLNFNKVRAVFEDKKVDCIVACGIQERRPLQLKNYNLVNPLLHDLD